MFPEERLVRGLHARRDRRQAARPQDLRRGDRAVPRARSGKVSGARGFLPAPRRAAVARHGHRRQAGVRLPRTGNGLRRQDDRNAGPAGARLSRRSAAYPTIERYGFVWVWPGDPGARPIPPSCITSSGPRAPTGPMAAGMYHVNCDYRLMIDNLMDLTHETYVHASSIGQPEIDETPTQTVTEGDTVITSRHMENIMAPPFWRMALRGNHLADDVPVDRWQICRFTPPSHVMIEVGVAHAGTWRLPRRSEGQGIEHRGRLHHARDRDLDLVFLGHGAQFQSARQGADRQHPRRAGQDLRRRPGDARDASSGTCSRTRSASCSSSISIRAACSRAASSSGILEPRSRPAPDVRMTPGLPMWWRSGTRNRWRPTR